MKTVSPAQDWTGTEEMRVEELALPASVQATLGQLVNAAKDGLLALSVGVGLGVLHELMEVEVDEVVGPKGKHDPDRAAVRHGHEAGEVTLGGRRVGVQRPRARAVDGSGEIALDTYAHFADRDPLTRLVVRADARRCEHQAAGPHPRAGRRAGQRRGAVGVEVGGLADVHRPHAGASRRADGTSPG